jgi:colanic acid/amylovoran biosynthesis glycosyltransferase
MDVRKKSAICYITANGIGNAWVAAELRVIKDAGIGVDLYSMRKPQKSFFGSGWANQINDETISIYPLPFISFLVSIVVSPFLYKRRFFSALLNALFSSRENVRARFAGIAHLFVACHWARNIRFKNYQLIHSQWIQSGGTIGFYASWLLDIPFSFTGHAVDLFRDRCALKDKIERADFIVAISEFHRQFYINEGADPEKIHIVYCGIDLSEYPYQYVKSSNPIKILSFGRLVEKKGFSTLIYACGLLREQGVDFKCEIAGSGPEYQTLIDLIHSLDLGHFVTVTGQPLKQEDIESWMCQGDIFAQPCCWSKDNDIDGIPRSLMEAMAVGLPSISTRVAGIPDLIEHKKSGLLIDENDTKALSDAIVLLQESWTIREEMSRSGRRMIDNRFNLDNCLDPLVDLFQNRINIDNCLERGTLK